MKVEASRVSGRLELILGLGFKVVIGVSGSSGLVVYRALVDQGPRLWIWDFCVGVQGVGLSVFVSELTGIFALGSSIWA